MNITEIFMAKAGKGNTGFKRCFHGTIRRETNENNEEIRVYGKIKVNNGYIFAKGKDQWELGDKLDELVIMILDGNLHGDSGKTSKIAELDFFHN